MSQTLDHVILPKNVTDDCYSTWNTYYEELFPPSSSKPRYRPLSKLFSFDDVTKSSPDLVETFTTSSGQQLNISIPNTCRVGDNIDEFIRTNRSNLFKSNSTNDIFKGFEEKEENTKLSPIIIDVSLNKEKFKRKLNSSESRKKRISWCGVNSCLNASSRLFTTQLNNKRKTYECMDENALPKVQGVCASLEEEYSVV